MRAVCSHHRGWCAITPTIHQLCTAVCHDRTMATRAKVGEQPVNVRLPRDLHEAVLDRAEKEDRTMAQTIRVALRYYLQETQPIASV